MAPVIEHRGGRLRLEEGRIVRPEARRRRGEWTTLAFYQTFVWQGRRPSAAADAAPRRRHGGICCGLPCRSRVQRPGRDLLSAAATVQLRSCRRETKHGPRRSRAGSARPRQGAQARIAARPRGRAIAGGDGGPARSRLLLRGRTGRRRGLAGRQRHPADPAAGLGAIAAGPGRDGAARRPAPRRPALLALRRRRRSDPGERLRRAGPAARTGRAGRQPGAARVLVVPAATAGERHAGCAHAVFRGPAGNRCPARRDGRIRGRLRGDDDRTAPGRGQPAPGARAAAGQRTALPLAHPGADVDRVASRRPRPVRQRAGPLDRVHRPVVGSAAGPGLDGCDPSGRQGGVPCGRGPGLCQPLLLSHRGPAVACADRKLALLRGARRADP